MADKVGEAKRVNLTDKVDYVVLDEEYPSKRDDCDQATEVAGAGRKSVKGDGDSVIQKSAVRQLIDKIRSKLRNSSWYHSDSAGRLREFLTSRTHAYLSVFALFVAVFLPELVIVFGVTESTKADILLTAVMVGWCFDILVTSLVESTYCLSFFSLTDFLGTVAMAFDISYMLGTDAATPQTMSALSAKNVMVMRTSRVARVGARIGRFARVLRIMKFAPLVGSGPYTITGTSRGIASVVYERLSTMLSTTVAALTMILMISPLLQSIVPRTDGSMRAWVERISFFVGAGDMHRVNAELADMVTFFSHDAFGPFEACIGHSPSHQATHITDFVCEHRLTDWAPRISEPGRHGSILLMNAAHVQVCFNMQAVLGRDALCSFGQTVCIMFIMVFSSFTLSSVVAELAVRPLERILLTLQTAFTTTGEEWFQEQAVEPGEELHVLEKVVDRLATVASLQASVGEETLSDAKDLQDEEVGVLDLLRGGSSKAAAGEPARRLPSKASSGTGSQSGMSTNDFGVSAEIFESLQFNTLELSLSQNSAAAVFTVLRFHEPGEGFFHTRADEDTLRRFVGVAESEYLPIPFHCFAHAVDVVKNVDRQLRLSSSSSFLSELEQFVLLIAAVGHDLGHIGLNNGFLLESGHALALQYNDCSPLENMHCAKLYSILSKPATNVFETLSKDRYKEARKHVIRCILHTDMIHHQTIVKQLQMTYEMNSEVFRGSGRQPVIDLFSEAETKNLLMESFLHSADVSNPCRTWDVTQAWANRCLEEFFGQGDQEKELGIPVHFLNDRENLNRPNSQIGFMEFMIVPLFLAQICLFGGLAEYTDNLSHNIGHWEELWLTDCAASDEEKQKVRTRVTKVQASLQTAKESSLDRGVRMTVAPATA